MNFLISQSWFIRHAYRPAAGKVESKVAMILLKAGPIIPPASLLKPGNFSKCCTPGQKTMLKSNWK